MVTKSKARKVVTRPPKPRTTSKPANRVVADVFTTEGEGTIHVPAGSVHLVVNGTSRGLRSTDNMTFGEFARSQASQAGIKTFSLYADGSPVNVQDGGKRMTGVVKLEIVAKDSRG